MIFRGCAKGESGTPKASTQLAPNGAINQVSPECKLNQLNTPMANTVPINEKAIIRNGGTGGAAEVNNPLIDIYSPKSSYQWCKVYRTVYLKVNQSVYTQVLSLKRFPNEYFRQYY
jgi:hypothetical protein